MKKFKALVILLLLYISVLLTGCVYTDVDIEILNGEKETIYIGETLYLDYEIIGINSLNKDKFQTKISYSGEAASANSNGVVVGISEGISLVTISVISYDELISSDVIIIEVVKIPNEEQDDPITSDPYVDVTEEEFYANYEIASSYMDAYYRTLHGFMSGSIYDQDQKPTISNYQPKEDNKLIRNSNNLYSNDGNTYSIVDCYGDVVMKIYRGGAYVVLEEVAAYVLAFNEIPANYTPSKKTKPENSIWGKYLRLNNTKFSGSTAKYPYEPELPNISGCGGMYQYYEIDLGTTGTDCDTSYKPKVYNDGHSITRGAARIVYSYSDINGNEIIEIDERYLFYTYNHYNDFQEYLNYYGGWGEIFGNITGGGVLSSKTNYNPTSYVESILKALGN